MIASCVWGAETARLTKASSMLSSRLKMQNFLAKNWILVFAFYLQYLKKFTNIFGLTQTACCGEQSQQNVVTEPECSLLPTNRRFLLPPPISLLQSLSVK